jgi:hypothetical protein
VAFIPDDVAGAARRLAAKMVADQAVDIMYSFVGLSHEGQPTARELTELALTDPESALVIVAKGKAKLRILRWLCEVSRTAAAEVVRVRDGKATDE